MQKSVMAVFENEVDFFADAVAATRAPESIFSERPGFRVTRVSHKFFQLFQAPHFLAHDENRFPKVCAMLRVETARPIDANQKTQETPGKDCGGLSAPAATACSPECGGTDT